MSLLRTAEQAKLADLLAIARGLAIRYEELSNTAGDRLTPVLQRILDTRRPLLDSIAAAIEARGDLPPVADLEINELRAIIDRVLASLLGEQALETRLLHAEEDWCSILQDAKVLDWTDAEAKLLDALETQADESQRMLRGAADR